MKKERLFAGLIIIILGLSADPLCAQEDKEVSPFSVGADVFTNYIWRGTKYGKGPAFQPNVEFVSGGLSVGVWGSFDASGFAETDPYISYSLPVGLSIGLTDYYYPGLKVFEISDTTGSHAFEINAGFDRGGLSLSANYVINQAGGIGSEGGDIYFEAGYAFKYFNILLGAGDGWHTTDGKFAICNIGIGTSKTIKLSDSFAIPVSGQVILNPEREQLFVVVGFSF